MSEKQKSKDLEHSSVTEEGFRKWLHSKEPAATVGYVAGNYDCPIANYITETVSLKAPKVKVVVPDETRWFVAPAWFAAPVEFTLPPVLSTFIKLLDEAYEWSDDYAPHEVAAEEALEILEMVYNEVEGTSHD